MPRRSVAFNFRSVLLSLVSLGRPSSVFPVLFVSFGLYAELLRERFSMPSIVRRIVKPLTIKREAEVRYLEMPIGSDEKVVWLDVAMNKSQLVSLFDANYHLGNVVAGHVFFEDVFADEEAQEVTTGHILHDKVQVDGVLKASDEGDDPIEVISVHLGLIRIPEKMVSGIPVRHLRRDQEVPLGAQMALLAAPNHVRLSNNLHGKGFAPLSAVAEVRIDAMSLPYEPDNSKAALAQDLE